MRRNTDKNHDFKFRFEIDDERLFNSFLSCLEILMTYSLLFKIFFSSPVSPLVNFTKNVTDSYLLSFKRHKVGPPSGQEHFQGVILSRGEKKERFFYPMLLSRSSVNQRLECLKQEDVRTFSYKLEQYTKERKITSKCNCIPSIFLPGDSVSLCESLRSPHTTKR